MTAFLDFIFYFFVGLIVTKVCLFVLTTYLEKKSEEMFRELSHAADELHNKFILVDIEKHGDMIYLFEKDSHRFIAQGKDKSQIMLHCNQRFPGRTIVTDEEQAGNFNL